MPPYFVELHIGYIVAPLVPLIAGLSRLKKMDPAFHSLIYIFGAAVVAEIIRFINLYTYYINNQEDNYRSFIGYNFYVLIIGLLYTHFFFKLGLFKKREWLYKVMLIALPLLWIFDHFVIHGYSIHKPTIIYRLFYAFFLCLYAVQQINKLLVTERGNLLTNPAFLVCFCLLFFFLPYIISEGIFLFNPKVSDSFAKAVFLFRSYANPINYLIFTVAMLWIPPKKNFIQLS